MVFKAICVVTGEKVKGVIRFTQEAENKPTLIEGKIEGLPVGQHGFHVHEWGDNSKGCMSAGAHFNPFKKTHGGPDVCSKVLQIIVWTFKIRQLY